MDKEDVVHTYIQWSITQPLKHNKTMPFTATGMQLENTILSEISQKEKDKGFPVAQG